jgi:hypothetical protein
MKTLIGDLDALYQYTAGLACEPFTCGNRERMFIARRPVTDMARGRLGAPIAALAWVLAREVPGLRMVLRPELGLTPLLAKQPVLIADFAAPLASSELTALARSRRLNGAVYSLPSSAPSPRTRSWKGRLKRPLAAQLMAGARPRAVGRPVADPSPSSAGPRPSWRDHRRRAQGRPAVTPRRWPGRMHQRQPDHL